jgi:5-methylcytosine-specific restriction enzyme subunit McrC
MATERRTMRESRPEPLELTEAQRDRLVKVGERLASNSTWWGALEDEPREGTLITCEHVSGSQYRVTVNDAVGAIGLPGLNLVIRPKVTLSHFVYLLAASVGEPRFLEDLALADPEASLFELVAAWFLDAAERLLRLGLVKDYRETGDVLPIARGRIRPIGTARLYYAGRVAVDCEFDEFDHDNALNRLIKGAAKVVARNQDFKRDLRRRSSRVVAQFDDVSVVRPSDLDAIPDLRASHYREPVAYAKWVLFGQGVAPRESEHGARTFLLRSPELIEGGIRNVLADGLEAHWGLERKPHGRQVIGAPITLHPDLVFDGAPVTGDVKYKLPRKWDRRDLEQAVVFATGFKAEKACVVHFERGDVGKGSSLPELKVGDLEVTAFAWNFGEDIDPSEAAQALVTKVSFWLGAISEGHQPRLGGLVGVAS